MNATADPAGRWAPRILAFCSGLTRAKIETRVTGRPRPVVVDAVEVVPGKDVVGRGHAERSAHGRRDDGVVAGHDLHPYARSPPVASPTRRRKAFGGSWKTRKPVEREPVLLLEPPSVLEISSVARLATAITRTPRSNL